MAYAAQPLSKEEELELIRRITAETPTKKQAAEFDLTRVVRMDLRDPRCQPTQWPCYNHHQDGPKGANAHGCWIHCASCNLPLLYVPRKGSPASQTSCTNPAMVLRMLNALQPLMHNKMPTAKICHAMMQKINADEVLETAINEVLNPKDAKTPKNVKKGSTAKGSAAPPTSSPTTSSGSWQPVTPPGPLDDLTSHLNQTEVEQLQQLVADRKAKQAESSETQQDKEMA